LNARLQYLFNLLETDRLSLLDSVGQLTDKQFNLAPLGKWSIHQILAHLITAEALSISYMNKKVLGIAEAGDSGLLEEGKMLLLKVSQRFPFKFKAPRAVVENTKTYSDFHQLSMAWEQERVELKKLLEQFDDGQIKKKIYRHIRAGRLNIQHALIFFREHYIHHLPQIKRLL
jgi:hypothetical protein